MPKKMPELFNYLANNPEHVADPEIEEFMENEIARAPKDTELLAKRLHNNTAASPQDAGGDLDADWDNVKDSGTKTFKRDSHTPHQSMVEEKASAISIRFNDTNELHLLEIM